MGKKACFVSWTPFTQRGHHCLPVNAIGGSTKTGGGKITSTSSAVAALIARFLPFGMVVVLRRILQGKAVQGRTEVALVAEQEHRPRKKCGLTSKISGEFHISTVAVSNRDFTKDEILRGIAWSTLLTLTLLEHRGERCKISWVGRARRAVDMKRSVGVWSCRGSREAKAGDMF